jgi:NADH-quinone oxidoreductase subunit L
MTPANLIWVLLAPLFLPLGGGAAAWLISRRQPAPSRWLLPLALLLASLLTASLLGKPAAPPLAFPWIPAGVAGEALAFSLSPDGLALPMALLVCGISALVALYSAEYMRHDPRQGLFGLYLGFFCSAMLGLVLAADLWALFLCWESVGLASYLLIGFWRERERAGRAAQKAFIVNRIGDACLLVGIAWAYSLRGSVSFAELGREALPLGPSLLLFAGAMGKSAQLPLQGWLPDAMEGPTPVSSLLHAATMVAAGIYLTARMFPLFDPQAGAVIASLGTATALWGALSALRQQDLKRLLAYSTLSQLGLMMLGIGAGAPEAALFHLFTHAFFKCALFLMAGVLIHRLEEAGLEGRAAQDLRQMGGLARVSPALLWLGLPPMLALAGVPFFSGFLSKDALLGAAWAMAERLGGAYWLFPLAGLIVSLLTAAYMFRLGWMIFAGPQRGSWDAAKIHRLRLEYAFPLAVLALGSLGFGFARQPLDPSTARLAIFLPVGAHAHAALGELSVLAVLLGSLLSWLSLRGLLRLPPLPLLAWQLDAFPLRLAGLLARFDQRVLDGAVNGLARLFAAPGERGLSFSRLLAAGDAQLLDGLVNGLAGTAAAAGRRLRNLQSGWVQRYVLYSLAGLLLAWWLWQFWIG